MERMFDSVADAGDDADHFPLIIATPAQLRAAMDQLSTHAFYALMLVLEHGFRGRENRVQVYGWSRRWLIEKGMRESHARRAVSELARKGYMHREMSDLGVLGRDIGVVTDGLFTRTQQTVRAPRPRQKSAPIQATRRPSQVPAHGGRRCLCGSILAAPQPGAITYVIERSGFIKIGSTTHLAGRITSLSARKVRVRVPEGFNPDSPTVFLGVTQEAEHSMHQRFAGNHVTGEWFEATSAVRRRLLELVEQPDSESA